jgi:hypothetical protein
MACVYVGKQTHFTKFSSSLLLALIGGVVGSSVFFPPSESAAPVNVTPRVAMASCISSSSSQLYSDLSHNFLSLSET